MLPRRLFSRLHPFAKPSPSSSSNVGSSHTTVSHGVLAPRVCEILPRRLLRTLGNVGSVASKSRPATSCSSSSSFSSKTMDVTDRVPDPKSLSDNDWKQRLDKETFKVCRLKGTEYPGSGKYLHHAEKGTYVCVCCRANLFRSEDKFNHCGWPSFRQAMDTTKDGSEDATNVKREFDGTHGMERTEVLCKKCDSHLGHVFNDGPEPFGTRFCINSVSLDFVKD